jgi:parvulin-like peptidyl-prolyl isomerase
MPLHPRSILALAALSIALVATACGGGGEGSAEDVPDDAIAVVSDEEISRAEYQRLLDQAEKTFKARKQEFPQTGTPEFEQLRQAIVRSLVEQKQFEVGAEELGIEVTEEEVTERLDELKQQFFDGDDEKYRAELAKQGLSEEQVLRDVRARLLSEKIYEEVTKDVTVTDQAVRRYYEENRAQFETPETREVRHILVKRKAQADDIYRQLRSGGDFAALAKEFSQDPASKDQGGRFEAQKGATVPPFDRTAFSLETGELSEPVKTQFGWHLIEALSAVQPKATRPLSEVEADIRQQLLQQEQNEAMNTWVEELRERLEEDTAYAVGFQPPEPGKTTTGVAPQPGGTETQE